MADPFQVWYRSHPVVALLVAACLFAAVTILQFVWDDSGEAVCVLFTLPIALLAIAFGLRAGLAGAGLGFGLFAMFAVVHNVGDLDLTGWVTRATAMFLLGGLVGFATDRVVASEQHALAEQQRLSELEDSRRREREALEINDSIIQGMATAKWVAEQGRVEEAIETIAATMERGTVLVTRLLGESGAASGVSAASAASLDGSSSA